MNIFLVGGSGLIGSRIVELLSKKHTFTNLSLETGIDITNPHTLNVIESYTDHSILLHLAAKVDVDSCEKDKQLGEKGDAWRINVVGTQNVIDVCKKSGKKILYISTDFVFDGTKPQGTFYTEEDDPHPINWYGETKWRGEEIVRKSGLPFAILRLAYPYRQFFSPKNDFVRAILSRLKKGENVVAVSDHIITPTFVDDIAWAVDAIIEANSTGIYHVVGSEFISPYEAALLIAQEFGFDSSFIRQTTRSEFFVHRAPRPYNLALKNDKIRELGVYMKTFKEGLRNLKKDT